MIQPIPVEVQNLIQALQSDYESVRYSAVDALGQISELALDAIPMLTQALGHENKSVRRWAVSALGRIGTPEALKVLEKYEKLG